MKNHRLFKTARLGPGRGNPVPGDGVVDARANSGYGGGKTAFAAVNRGKPAQGLAATNGGSGSLLTRMSPNVMHRRLTPGDVLTFTLGPLATLNAAD